MSRREMRMAFLPRRCDRDWSSACASYSTRHRDRMDRAWRLNGPRKTEHLADQCSADFEPLAADLLFHYCMVAAREYGCRSKTSYAAAAARLLPRWILWNATSTKSVKG